jgi:ankyrin repeat protein
MRAVLLLLALSAARAAQTLSLCKAVENDYVSEPILDGDLDAPKCEDGAATPLELAASLGYELVVGALLRAGATPTTTTLALAAVNGHVRVVDRLLEFGADPNGSFGSENATPLLLAAAACQAGSVKALLQAGADASLENVAGETALTEWRRACGGLHEQVVLL